MFAFLRALGDGEIAMKRVLITATVQSHICQFHKPLIKVLKENGYEVHVAARDNLAEKNGLKMEYVDQVFNIPFERSPLRRKNIPAYKALKEILRHNAYDVIHTNTPVASVLTRFAARKYRHNGTKVFYTAHGFHFYDGAPLKNWLLYYPIEFVASFWTDILIVMNQEDYQRAVKLRAREVRFIHGVGVDLERFDLKWTIAQREKLRQTLGVSSDEILLLSVGELNKNKNHEVVIRAIAEMDHSKIKYFICGNGPLEAYLRRLIEELNLNDCVKLLGYRRDIPELNQAADIFVFPSLREGLPVALMEAMAAGNPIIASDIRGVRDLIKQDKGGILCAPGDKSSFCTAISMLMENITQRNDCGKYNQTVVRPYSVQNTVSDFSELYGLEKCGTVEVGFGDRS